MKIFLNINVNVWNVKDIQTMQTLKRKGYPNNADFET